MKRKPSLLAHACFALTLTTLLAAHANNQTPTATRAASQSAPIPMDQLGAVAGKQYQGDGLSVIATPDGASLRCAFQRLEGQVTREGLWLSSTADSHSGERFRVMATAVGRAEKFGVRWQSEAATPLWEGDWWMNAAGNSESGVALRFPPQSKTLRVHGTVSVNDQSVRFIRPGLIEEYTVSVDGVRQDFIIEQRPEGDGELRVELDVTGATAEPLVNGARLVLDGSGRKLAYNRLRVTDATGRELPARMEVSVVGDDVRSRPSPLVGDEITSRASSQALLTSCPTSNPSLAVLVDDASAIYPVRIDPTFSDADWISMGGLRGANNDVLASAVDGNGNLYIGGSFTVVGDVIANRIAKWDGNTWSTLGAGFSNGVSALVLSGNILYAGVNNSVAKWEGNTWSILGYVITEGPGPFNFAFVKTLAVSGTNLYVGGAFTKVNGIAATNVVRWDGAAWSPLGSGVDSWVYALAVSGSNVYAGGFFGTAGGSPANRIAKWDGITWSGLGSGMNGDVRALAVSGDDLYAGGNFSTLDSSLATNIARWDGSVWSALGSGMNSEVTTLAVSGTNVFAGGWFTTAGGIIARRIAKWDGNAWSALGSGMESTVYTLTVAGTNVYAGGYLITADGVTVNRIAKWNGTTWSALGLGTDNRIEALATSGTDLYLGGWFTAAGSAAANYIAKWDGSVWSALGTGMNSTVTALALSGTNLYAGGDFTTAGGVTVNSIAKWDGNAWSALGSGMGGPPRPHVYALAVSGTNLYVGGEFWTAGGIAANRIAKWDGNTWMPLGSGMNNGVIALALSGTDLYAGGWFATAGETEVNNIAKWDGNGWSALGTGMSGGPNGTAVSSLVVAGTALYAGGAFTVAGGLAISSIAKWDGNVWSSLGSDVIGVTALAANGTDVYVGGNFNTLGGLAINQIARWEEGAWSFLGSGMDAGIKVLTVSGTNLYAGGNFTIAGNKVSAYVAKANIGAARGRFSNLVYSPVTGFSCTFLDASVGQPYRIQTSTSLAAGSWTDYTNFTYTAPIGITVPIAGNTNRFFRAITP